MKQKFKVGDKVYCLRLGNKIFTVHQKKDCHDMDNLWVGIVGGRSVNFDNSGISHDLLRKGQQVVTHATTENYEMLSKLYPNTEFEAPPKRKTPQELIQAMLESGKWHLVNYRIYGNAQQALNDTPKNKVITKSQYDVIDFKDYFNKYAYCNVEVIDPKTGKVIIDYIDGEIVTE